VVAEVKFSVPHKSQLRSSARTDGDVLRYRDRHAPITPAWRRHAPISLHSTTSLPFVIGKPLHQPPPPPLPSHPKTFPSRLTLAAHHPISQPRHHRKANIKHQTPKRAGTERVQDTRVSALILHSARIRCLITPIYPGLVKARRRWEGVTTERCRDGGIGWESALQDRRLRRPY